MKSVLQHCSPSPGHRSCKLRSRVSAEVSATAVSPEAGKGRGHAIHAGPSPPSSPYISRWGKGGCWVEVQSFDTEKLSPNHRGNSDEGQPVPREDWLFHLSYFPCGTDTKAVTVKYPL